MTAEGQSVVIAIDGPVAAGKGTIARRLATELGYAYLDTGSLYRAVAAKLIADGEDPENVDVAVRYATELTPPDLERTDLRREDVGQGASVVAAHSDVLNPPCKAGFEVSRTQQIEECGFRVCAGYHGISCELFTISQFNAANMVTIQQDFRHHG